MACELCPDNSVKSFSGDAVECNNTCHAKPNIPNDAHTACGETVEYQEIKRLAQSSFLKFKSMACVFL